MQHTQVVHGVGSANANISKADYSPSPFGQTCWLTWFSFNNSALSSSKPAGLRSAAETLNEAASKMEGAELANTLRNLLRSAKGGIPLKRLDDEFYTFSGVHIPLGSFRTLEDLLKTLPDVCSLRSNDRGHLSVYGTKFRGYQTATVLGGNSKGGASSSGRGPGGGGGQISNAGGSNKRPPPGGRGARGSHPQALQNNGIHYTPRPRTGPSGRLPRRLPQSSNYQANLQQESYGQGPYAPHFQSDQLGLIGPSPSATGYTNDNANDWDSEWNYGNSRARTPLTLTDPDDPFADWGCSDMGCSSAGGGVGVGHQVDSMEGTLGGPSPPPQWSTHEDPIDGSLPGGAGPAGGRHYRLGGGGTSAMNNGGGCSVMGGLEAGLHRRFIDFDDSTGQQHQHHQNRRNRNNNNNNNNGSSGTGGQSNHIHGSNASTSNGHWRGDTGRGPMSPGHHDNVSGNLNQSQVSFGSRRGNMVWINPSIQYNGSGGSRSSREYKADRPNAIPIVDPRSRRVVPMRHGGHHGVYGTPTGVGKNGAGQQQGNNSTTSLAMLEEFARASGLPAAEFQLMESKTNKKAAAAQFLCTVELDGIKYKSYPDYRPTAELAKEAAAAKALAALGITKDNLQQRVAEKQASLPLADMSTASQTEAIAVKLAQILEKRPNGVFSNSVPQLFAEEFKQKLPDDWQTKVAGHKLLDFVPNTVAKCDVLYRREAEGSNPAAQGSVAPQVPPLSITEEQFMFVTMLIVDVHNFYGRVEREEYHTLVSDMEVYYKVEANLAQQKLEPSDRPVVGALYAVYDESWHRVQCIADDAAGGEVAEFRYVDLGITELIPRQKLMHLAYDFYAVPFLAIQLRLEEFEESSVSESKRPSVQALMERFMQNKILWAVPAPGVDLSARPLPVKVYDTGDDSADCASSVEGNKDLSQGQQIDINTEIYKIVATPVIFPAPVIAKGYLSCVLPDGFIYLQIEDFGLSELRSLTVEPASDTPVESVQENKMYCAQLEGSWYRCVATNIVSNQEIDIEFIDYGNKDTVDIKKMFALKTGSHIEDLPPQAVRAHMTNLQPVDTWTVEELATITDFCPEDQKLIIKVSSSSCCEGRECDENIRHVDIFKRTQPNDELVSVNHRLYEELKATTSSTSSASNGHAGKNAGEWLATGSQPPLVPVYPKAEPPTHGTTIMLHVVSAASPLSLVIQPFNTSSELANLRAQMQLYYGKQGRKIKSEKQTDYMVSTQEPIFVRVSTECPNLVCCQFAYC
ncbi:uncharacterized protein LOC111269572 isoform X3 [Varroa jacobsoni]|uniref:uncharacterized protein LOC111269572 isoform X3 n=1 Tax=Varroa jacobsoni TaxID=62625 RepID=UPI000BF4D508|nr:uncharacterized protein LOC111269572 isoform X3 [Varroa jacobsoni]